jgi:TetR/AcrR family transcriptional regulator, tetracycline repressor protein
MSPTDHPPFLGAWTDTPEAEARSPREPLNRSRIVAAAVKILDRHGVESLSMRTLAEELHTAATSLYRHVHNKGELLDLTVDSLMAEVELPPTDLDWRACMRTVSLNFRAVLLAHRNLAVLRGTRLAIGPNTLRLMEFVCSRLLAAGFSEAEAAAAGATIINYTVGCVLGEVMPTAEIEASGYSWEQFTAEMSARVAALPLDRYPVMRRMLPMLLGHHSNMPFEYGLDALLDGLALRREAGAAAPEPHRP